MLFGHYKKTTQKKFEPNTQLPIQWFFIPLRTNHYSKPLNLLKTHYSDTTYFLVVTSHYYNSFVAFVIITTNLISVFETKPIKTKKTKSRPTIIPKP
jgi:hypothetical protein